MQAAASQSMPVQDSCSLRVRNLACERGERLLWSNLSFSLDAGQILQIIGENASGKTSLLRILAGLMQATSGEISWGSKAAHASDSSFKNELNFLAHQNANKADLTLRENLALTAALSQSKAKVDDALRELGLSEHSESLTHTLSAGQQRRLALARLILRPACLWILDEPFTALDSAAIKSLEGLLKQHLARNGIVIFTSHQAVELTGVTIQQLRLGAA